MRNATHFKLLCKPVTSLVPSYSVPSVLQVSRLGFGCMGLSGLYNTPFSHEFGCSIIKKAFDKGITFFDTADAYGRNDNEIMIGKVMLLFENLSFNHLNEDSLHCSWTTIYAYKNLLKHKAYQNYNNSDATSFIWKEFTGDKRVQYGLTILSAVENSTLSKMSAGLQVMILNWQ